LALEPAESVMSADRPYPSEPQAHYTVGENWIYRGKSWYLTNADGLSDEEKGTGSDEPLR